MHQSFDTEPVVARFTFRPERAEEFLADKDENGNLTYNGRLVSQVEYETIEEVMEDLIMFGDAIVDANAIVNGQVVNLSDYKEEA